MNDNIKAGADIHAGDGGYSIGTQEQYEAFAKGRNQSLAKLRLEELMYQAGLTAQGSWDEMDAYDRQAIEKFAELIVRECMEQVWYTREDGINGNISEVIKDRMKQHFGVEE